MSDPPAHYDVFLSHNNADKPAVEELARRLVQAGLQPWLDTWNLIPGDPWQEAIEGALRGCATCAVCIGPSGTGPWQNEEMRVAIDRRVSESQGAFRVIPVLLPGAERGERSRLPDFLVRAAWVEFRHTLDDEDAIHRLVAGIRGRAPGPGPGQAPFSGECPYRGLQFFNVEHASFFFGREALTEWLLDALRGDNRFLAVIGPSGSGKSSLARAGLLAALRRGALAGSEQWPTVILRPDARPLESLALALSETTPGATSGNLARLMDDLAGDQRTLHLTVRLALRGAAPEQRFVLLVDQFEEIFTLCRDEGQSRALINNLLYAAGVAGGQTIVILTLRADFYGKCAGHAALAAALAEHQVLVGPMDADELRSAIERPAQLAGCEFEPGLSDRLLADVQDQPGGLPLLQNTLLALWKGRKGNKLTHAAYDHVGGVAGALEDVAERIFGKFDEAQQIACQRIFLRLTQPGEGTEDTKRRAAVSELLPAEGNRQTIEDVILDLAHPDVRLVTTEGAGDQRFVEVSHEALIRGWPRLRKWIEKNREALRTQRGLGDAAQKWEQQGREESYLYRGARLAEADEWAAGHAGDLSHLERAFLDASLAFRDQEATEREAQRRRALEAAELLAAEAEARRQAEAKRAEAQTQAASALRRSALWLMAALAVALLAAGTAAWFWGRSNSALSREEAARQTVEASSAALAVEVDTRSTAEAAAKSSAAQAQANLEVAQRAQELAEERLRESQRQGAINRLQTLRALSQLELKRDAECSLALALSGYDLARTIPSFSLYPYQDDVRNALLETRTEQVLAANTVRDVMAWSADGRTLATAGQPGGTQLWAVAGSGISQTGRIDFPSWVGALAFSPDSETLAIGGSEIALWHRQRGAIIGALPLSSPTVRVLAWHPNSRWLASGVEDGTIVVWDARNQKQVQTLTAHRDGSAEAAVWGLAWSPNGLWLSSAGFDNAIRIWNVSDLGRQERLTAGAPVTAAITLSATWPVNEQGQPVRLAWSPNGRQLAASFAKGTILVFQVGGASRFSNSPPPSQELVGHTGVAWALAWNRDGSRLASSAEDSTIRVWGGEPLEAVAVLTGHSAGVSDVAWHPDGQRLVSASADQTLRLWRIAPGGVRMQQEDGYLLDAAWQPGKAVLAFGEQTIVGGFRVRLWNLESDRVDSWEDSHRSTVQRLAWSPAGDRIATAGADAEAHLYEAQSGELVRRFSGYLGHLTDVAWSAAGDRLAWGGAKDFSVRVWEGGAEDAKRYGSTSAVTSLAWGADGTALAAGSFDGLVSVWEVASGRRHDWSAHATPVNAVAWHSGGKWLASGGADGRIVLWDTASAGWLTGRLWKDTLNLSEPIWDLAWHGDLLAAAGANGAVRVWDAVSGEVVANYGGHNGAVRAVTWSDDGRYLATVGITDGRVIVHYADFAADLLPLARQQLERGSTAADRQRCLEGAGL